MLLEALMAFKVLVYPFIVFGWAFASYEHLRYPRSPGRKPVFHL